MGTNPPGYMREFMREYRAAGKDKHSVRQVSLTRPFIGCDGEGATLESGYHAYFMLRIGAETLRAQGSSVRLSTLECLEFISRQDPNAIYVGYFFDYDVTKILEDLPWQKLDRLINRHKRMGELGQLFPVDFGHYQIEYLPRKEFKVRRILEQIDDKTTWTPWVTISDVGTFFQMSFLRAIQVWNVGTEEEHEIIREGKLQRANFDTQDEHYIGVYNALEIRLLQELMDKFRAACVQAGYVPRKWQGPGVLAETMLRAHGVKKSKNVELLTSGEYSSLLQFGLNAYYGGRFEVAQIGPVNVPIHQYDINSAYPDAMQHVPCLEHGGWRYLNTAMTLNVKKKFDVPTGRMGESYALCYGTFKRKVGSTRSLWYGLPVRTSTGTIVFPERGKGWYWSFEIDAAIHQKFTPEQLWVYTRQCSCMPLAFVKGVYQSRQKLGKDGPGLILKLGLNSLYGKMVQSIGFPTYSNAIWGSFITAWPRMKIQNLIHSSPLCKSKVAGLENGVSCGRDIVMIATDSVASITERKDVAVSAELGGWSVEHHPEGMFVVQPGVYFGSSGKPTKTRGFTRTVVDQYEPAFRDAFASMVETGDMRAGQVALPIQIFCGIRYALQRRNMNLLGQWIEYGTSDLPGKLMSFDWTTKRMPVAINPTEQRPWILTLPYEGAEDIESIPYSRDIGGLLAAEQDRLAFVDLPDWSPLGDMYDD